MSKKIKQLTESEFKNLIRKYLLEETFYVPLSKDEKIRSEMSLEDKKMLYKYVDIGDIEGLKSKMHEIANKLMDKMGKEDKLYIADYLKRMVGRMIMIKKQSV